MERNSSDLTKMSETLKPAIYLIPVSISDGNPFDVLPSRNIEIIRHISHFVVENTRTARRFLKKVDKSIDIDSLTFYELNEHTEESEISSMLQPYYEGFPIGIMSEAGCPAVADPGARLVELAQKKGIKTVPLVGPSSILLALMASGMNGQNFTFNGYLPINEKDRQRALKNMSDLIFKHNITQIFIETPYRNNKLVEQIIRDVPSSFKLCVACDITGQDEYIMTRTIAEWSKNTIKFEKKPAIFLLGQ